MPAAACVPCREKKLRCNRQLPSCTNCARARIQCPGYGKNLSWPKSNNTKRSHVGPEPWSGSATQCAQDRKLRWANVRVEDLHAHQHLSIGQQFQEQEAKAMKSLLSFNNEPSWSPMKLDVSDLSLLQYFQLEAAISINCSSRADNLVEVLTRLAFHDDSAPSRAVLHAVLAVSSLRRHGANPETIARQGAALRALDVSSREGISGTKVVQHLATGVLLCCFEIYGKDRHSGHWFVYINNAKTLLKGMAIDKRVAATEFLAMTNWLYHHDVHAQFGLRHWRRKDDHREMLKQRKSKHVLENTRSMTELVQSMSKIIHLSTASHMVLWPMSDVFENIVDSAEARYHSERYRQELHELECSLESVINGKYVPETDRKAASQNMSADDYDYFTLEIYRLATLIYLERVSQRFSGNSVKIKAWTQAAFDLLRIMNTCKHSFPIFIIGCEARSDEQRIIILDCICQTQEKVPRASMSVTEEMVQSAWALEDLEIEMEVDYTMKLNTVVSGCMTMPSCA